MNWYIGQEVAYIGPTIPGIKHRETGKITGITRGCEHNPVMINIDNKIVPDGMHSVCVGCGGTIFKPGERLSLPHQLYTPLANISELEEIIKEEEVPV